MQWPHIRKILVCSLVCSTGKPVFKMVVILFTQVCMSSLEISLVQMFSTIVSGQSENNFQFISTSSSKGYCLEHSRKKDKYDD